MSPEQRDEIIEQWVAGVPTAEISERAGVTPARVRALVSDERKRRGAGAVPRRPQRLLGPARRRILLSMWQRRASVARIATVLGISRQQIYNAIRRARGRYGPGRVPHRHPRREGYRALDRAARLLRQTGHMPKMEEEQDG